MKENDTEIEYFQNLPVSENKNVINKTHNCTGWETKLFEMFITAQKANRN